MSLVGYARVSTAGQSLEVQLEQLEAAGCEKVFSEKLSGSSTAAREQLRQALAWVREGDVLIVCRLDRLARSMVDLLNLLAGLKAKGVGFRCLQQQRIDTTKPDGRLLLHLLASFAEFEADLRRERHAEGMARAKADGKYKGRPATVTAEAIRKVQAENPSLKPGQVCRKMGIGRTTYYRVLKAAELEKSQ